MKFKFLIFGVMVLGVVGCVGQGEVLEKKDVVGEGGMEVERGVKGKVEVVGVDVLGGKKYELKKVNGVNLGSGQVFIGGGRLQGKLCNGIGGDLRVEGGLMKSLYMSTLMYCEEPAGIMDAEAAVGKAFSDGASYEVVGERLILKSGEIILEFEEMKEVGLDGKYVMVSYNGNAVMDGQEFTLDFDGLSGKVSVKVCNVLNGDFRLEEKEGKWFLSTGVLAGTKMLCVTEGVMELEDLLGKAMVEGFEVSGFKDGKLVLNGKLASFEFVK